MGAWSKLSLLWRVLTVVGAIGAVGGALWGVYAYVRHQGYVAGYADATARCEAERKAQRQANQDAIDAANRELFRVADELSLKQSELDDARDALEAAAAADPHGARECLGIDSVRRLAPIR